MSAATIQDLLDMEKGKRPDGIVQHRNCGGQIAWTIMIDRLVCRRCSQSWTKAFLLSSKDKQGKPGYYQFVPEMDLVDGLEQQRDRRKDGEAG